MTRKISSVPMVLNIREFVDDVEQARKDAELEHRDIAILTGYHGWFRIVKAEYDNMRVDSFLKVCNLFDLDPRKYFVLR